MASCGCKMPLTTIGRVVLDFNHCKSDQDMLGLNIEWTMPLKLSFALEIMHGLLINDLNNSMAMFLTFCPESLPTSNVEAVEIDS